MKNEGMNEGIAPEGHIPDLKKSSAETHTVTTNAVKPNRTWKPVDKKTSALYPFSTIGWMDVSFGPSFYNNSTGVLVGPRLVLTAAHNIRDAKHGGNATAIEFVPGLYDTNRPFGPFKGTILYIDKNFSGPEVPKYDFALILLDKKPVNTGYLGTFYNKDDKAFMNYPLTVAGYPQLTKAPNPVSPPEINPSGKFMWTDNGKVDSITSALEFNHKLDIWIGHSGAPLWTMINGWPYVVGVQSAHTPSNAPAINNACRLDSDRVELIKKYILQYP